MNESFTQRETFNFLGFPHMCDKTPDGTRIIVLRRTMAKRLHAKSALWDSPGFYCEGQVVIALRSMTNWVRSALRLAKSSEIVWMVLVRSEPH